MIGQWAWIAWRVGALLVLWLCAAQEAPPVTSPLAPEPRTLAPLPATSMPAVGAPQEANSRVTTPLLTGPAQPPAATPAVSPTPTPWRVGLQVGHWQIADLPPALARLRDHTGTVAAGRTELSLNLDVARRTAQLLERAGVIVDLLPATVPNGYRAAAFVAIHADGNATRPDRGYKIAPPWRSAVAWRDAVLVAQLEAAYSAATGLPRDPGVTDNMRGYYATNGWMDLESRISEQTPGVVIETGFMTSAADRAVLFDQPDRVAAGLAAGILAFLHAGAEADALQQRASAVAAVSPTGCSVVVLRDAVPARADPDPSAPAVAWVDRGAILPYLDSTARPPGPFTDAQGRLLAVQTGYYRVAPPGGGPPAYINKATVVVQLPGP